MCPWNPNIPLATDQIKNSQGDILGDFQAINGALGGVVQAALIAVNRNSPGTAANQIAVYNGLGATSGLNELSFQRSGGGIGGPAVAFSEGFAVGVTGYSRFASGILIKWGTVPIPASVNDAATVINQAFPGGQPNFTALSNVIVSATITLDTTTVGADISYVTTGSTTGNLKIKVTSLSLAGGWDAFICTYWAIGQG